MVSYPELRDARPALWRRAADDWLRLAKEAERAAEEIYDQGTAALPANWADRFGQAVAKRMKELATAYQVAAATMHGVVNTLDGLGDSVETLQRSLHAAVQYAHSHGLIVRDDGRVVRPPGRPRPDDARHIAQASALIAEALQSATRVDDEASAELAKLARAVGNPDLDKALNVYQGDAAINQIDLLRERLPIGQDPVTVRMWWDSLTDDQRWALERAVPVELYDLNGIPDETRFAMRGTEGFDRIEVVRWAKANWNNPDIDIFANNCANFVSSALHQAGMAYKLDSYGPDAWGRENLTGIGWVDARTGSHTRSWTQAEAQRWFFLDNGGEEVPVSQARPGDLMYWEHRGPHASGLVHLPPS